MVQGVEKPLVGHDYAVKLLGDENAEVGLGLPAGLPSQQINTLMHLISSKKNNNNPASTAKPSGKRRVAPYKRKGRPKGPKLKTGRGKKNKKKSSIK